MCVDGGGSSPLTRGKRHARVALSAADRLIPAHAGKTSTPTGRTSGRGAHPRSRGENTLNLQEQHASPGSSPLTRGKLSLMVYRVLDVGLIPAHAGKTRVKCCRRCYCWAHPRSRGENSATPTVKGEFKGSSPLTRGKRSAFG